jgi:P4 family phage/plasmid primase-like protien
MHTIRPGRCEDYISMSTLNDYVPYTFDSPIISEIMNFISKVLPNEDVREYVLTLLGSFLDGNTGNEKFHIWVGSGGNGKSKLIELFQLAMGEYCGSLPVTVITQNRPASNAASPELARLKGKRFVSIQEPNEKEKLQVGRMKELTGGDTIYARSLHKEPIEYKPQFKMILACNHLPKVPPDDGGTWRRIRVVRFSSKFVENPDPDDPDQFKADTNLHEKLSQWKEGFFWLLTQYYKRYKLGDAEKGILPGVKEPKEVLEVTNQYRNRNDILSEFMQEHTTEDAKCVITLIDLYSRYLSWCRMNGFVALQRNDFQETVENRIGNICTKRKGWKGYRLLPFVNESGQEDVVVEDDEENIKNIMSSW